MLTFRVLIIFTRLIFIARGAFWERRLMGFREYWVWGIKGRIEKALLRICLGSVILGFCFFRCIWVDFRRAFLFWEGMILACFIRSSLSLLTLGKIVFGRFSWRKFRFILGSFKWNIRQFSHLVLALLG